MQHDAGGLEGCNGVVNDSFEYREIHFVVDAVLKRNIKAEMFAEAGAVVVELARSREEIASVFVEGDGHDAVGMIESEFDAVAMVDIDVDVQNAGVVPV